MIEIINKAGRVLELSAGTVIPVERNNSLFNAPDKFIQDVIYPGKTGLTENNIIFIENGHLVESENQVYEIEVNLVVSGYQFFAGLFVYSIVDNQINYSLKVNFGAVANTVKNTSIRSIIALDPDTSITSEAILEARMKATCENPRDYPCVFFPVKNDRWSNTTLPITYPWVNYWDHAAQQFKISPSEVPAQFNGTAQAPFFRYLYILRKVLECLKFTVSGGAFSEDSEQDIYFYTRIGIRGQSSKKILPSLSYMPDMKIAEFLKQLTERRKISIEFDVLASTITVETPDSVLNSPDILDISNYIESVQQISTAESKGYEITLKIDDTDDAWNTGNEDEKIFNPLLKLHIGQSETKIEMAIGTLNKVEDTDYSYPVNKQEISTLAANDVLDWSLNMLKYTGMKDLGEGIVFPEARPLDLDLSDATWPKFLNDSKPLIIYANFPPSLLAKIKPTMKLGIVSKEGFYFVVLPSKISYQLTNQDSDLIRVKIEGRYLVNRSGTLAYIEVIAPEIAGKKFIQKFVAYYDPENQGMKSVKIERFPLPGSDATFGFLPITDPCNDMGLGGSIGMTYAITGSRTDMENSEDRLFSDIEPQYYIKNGVKGFFTAESGYYSFDPLAGSPEKDDRPVFIVF